MDDHRFRAAMTLATALMLLPVLLQGQMLKVMLQHRRKPYRRRSTASRDTAASDRWRGKKTNRLRSNAQLAKVGGASFGLNPTASLQTKSWQAPNGMIEFTIDSFASIPAGSLIGICTRWAQQPPERAISAHRHSNNSNQPNIPRPHGRSVRNFQPTAGN